MKLRRPSPALVIAFIALLAALAGTAYAATRITKSNQIKDGVITYGKLSKGARQSIQHNAGARSVAMEAFRKVGPEHQGSNAVVKVASLTIPAGVYVITAKTVMTADGSDTTLIEGLTDAPASLGGHCKLDTGGDVDESTVPIVIRNRPSPNTLTMQITRTVGAPTEIDLLCDASAGWSESDTSIIALKVDSSTRTESTP